MVARFLCFLGHGPQLDLGQASFRDVDGDEWWYGAALVAAGAGVMRGYPDRTFRGKQTVTQKELAVMIARLLDIAARTSSNRTDLYPDISAFRQKELRVDEKDRVRNPADQDR